MSDEAREKELVASAAECRYGLNVDRWDHDDMGTLMASFGRWYVSVEDEARGLYEGDEGELSACVVGSPEYDNERVAFSFTQDDFDPYSGPEVEPFEELEPL